MTHLTFESIHRTLHPMPVIVMFDVNGLGIELLAHVPSRARLFDRDMDDVTACGDVAI
jgi:hypothetical protein